MANKNNISFVVEDWTIEQTTGYKPITTFFTDFSIADKFGVDAIKDTYNRAFNEWKGNYKYVTELVMALNWKGWRWNEVNDDYSSLYFDLYRKAAGWCEDNLKGEELDYYYQITD